MQSLVGGGPVQTQLYVDKYKFSKQRDHNHDLRKIQKGFKSQKDLSFICWFSY